MVGMQFLIVKAAAGHVLQHAVLFSFLLLSSITWPCNSATHNPH